MFKIIADHTPPFKIVLIIGDRPISPIIEVLVFRGFDIILLHTSCTSEKLVLTSTLNIDWNVFLGLAKSSSMNLLTRTESNTNNNNNQLNIPVQLNNISTTEESFSPSSIEACSSIYYNVIIDDVDNNEENSIQVKNNDNTKISQHYLDIQNSSDYQDTQPIELNTLSPHSSIDYGYPYPSDQQIEMEQQHIYNKFRPLLETIQLLQRSDKPQVLLSMLGGRCDWKNMGYSKLRDYVFDAYQQC